METNNLFITELLSEIINGTDLLVLRDKLIKYKNEGMSQKQMLNNLEMIRDECDGDIEDMVLDLMDFVVGFCRSDLSIF